MNHGSGSNLVIFVAIEKVCYQIGGGSTEHH
jgi:hypothetical protein